jgi:hypothetical protein
MDSIIKTFSNAYLDLANPKPSSLVLHDMVQGIAREGRFANQCSRHCSVAEHSVLVSHLVKDTKAQALALVHDLPEAYIRDIPSPFKNLIPDCKRYEDALFDCVIKKFKIKYTDKLWRVVKTADMEAFNLERVLYFNDSAKPDKVRCATVIKNFGWTPGLTPHKAIALFYKRWKELGLPL